MDRKFLCESLSKLETWTIQHDYKGYDPFDGLSSYLRVFTLKKDLPQRILQQFIRRIPFNLRPLLGIKIHRSTKGISFLGSGYLKLYELTERNYYREQAKYCFDWLTNNYSRGYAGYCWGNSFDYISRAFYLPVNAPTLVWTSLIGHHFAEAYRLLKDEKYLDVINSIGDFIMNDIPLIKSDAGTCLSYVTFCEEAIHNANLLGARMLAEIYALTGRTECKELALTVADYSVNSQRADGSWYYGEDRKYQWIDNWHTAYNLDSLYGVITELNEDRFKEAVMNGMDFYVNNFFRENGAPKYYWDRDYKYDIQSASQSIDTLVLLSNLCTDRGLEETARKTAHWTIKNMQDRDGYFYLWKSKLFTNKTPTFHWGNATMFRALVNLLSAISKNEMCKEKELELNEY